MEKSNTTLLNKRGDKRGSNGRSAKRGPGGRFLHRADGSILQKETAVEQLFTSEPSFDPLRPVQGLSATFPPMAAPVMLQVRRKLRGVSNEVNYDESSDQELEDLADLLSNDIETKAAEAAAPAAPAANESSGQELEDLVESLSDDTETTAVAAEADLSAAAVPPVLASTISTATTTTQVAFRQDISDTYTYSTASSAPELARISSESGFKPSQTTASQKDYLKLITYQCGLDRRDNGSMLPHVVEIDTYLPPMDRFRTYDTTSKLEITGITTDSVTRSVLGGIFVQRQLLAGTPQEIEHDMKIFSESPFNMIVVKRGEAVEGGAVFRAHTLNTGERVIHLELIATEINAARGGGSALMRVIRKLSQVSALHNGHVVALTLKTKDTCRFYQRKLPEHGPQARAVMASIALLDETTILKRNLDIRYTTVFAV